MAASSSLVLAALPMFLVSGLAVQIRGELGFSEAQLGVVVATAFLVGAAAAPTAGRLADRVGPRLAVLAGGGLSIAALTGIALAATTWWHLAALMAVAGVALAVTDPGLAVLVARAVPPGRQGLAFGVKEASIPVATLAAGLAVPAIALTLGWRWAFVIAAAPALVVLATMAGLRTRARESTSKRASASASTPGNDVTPPAATAAGHDAARSATRGPLRLIAVAGALGLTAASGAGVFLTESAVAMGLDPGDAGLLLATGSGAGVVTRLVAGWLADRTTGPQIGAIAGLLGAGAATMALGAAGPGPLLVVAAVGTFAGGWGWTGLLFLSLVRASPATPGAAAGLGVVGVALGNGLGPVLFGLTAQLASTATAWLAAAALAGLGAALMAVAQRWLRRAAPPG